MSDLPQKVTQPEFAGLIGVAREDITPPVGIYARNWGASAHEVAEGIHRPLTATALTLQATATEPPLVLVALDLGWWRAREDEWFVRGALLEALSLDPARLLMPLCHTHAGPSLCRADADRPGGPLVAPYLEQVRDAVIRAAQRALQARQPATLSWGTGRCDLAQNRDLPDPDGDRFICGYNATVTPDDTLLVGRVTNEAGEILATLVNYACHPTTLAWENRLISPDYIGALHETVEAHTGNAPCLFLLGACGDLAPREQYTADTAIPDAHGRKLGYAALAVLEGMLPPQTRLHYGGVQESGAPLALWQRASQPAAATLNAAFAEVELPVQPLPSFAALTEQWEACEDPVLKERLLRKRRIRQNIGEGDTARMPLWAWRVGDALFLAQPNEAYSHLQTHLRRQFPERAVVVMNLVNGAFGYLPPAELYDEDIYQAWQTPFARGSLERIVAASEEAARQATE